MKFIGNDNFRGNEKGYNRSHWSQIFLLYIISFHIACFLVLL